ncbi:MAG: branched-chain amino acid ABC transporter permease [Gammaproteobacteria bacterium]|nr:branched-chain amino acid ABC transporter permease [Gammaproteobacteria bacterium]
MTQRSEKQGIESAAIRSRNRFSEEKVAVIVFIIFALLPIFITGYPIYILPQYMLFGVLAMSLALLWGFVGILSFGQAAFFALGAYTMGLAMQTNFGVNSGYIGILISPLVGGVLAAITGYFLFNAGVKATYFVLVTLALSIMIEQIAVSQSDITGGWNGMYIDRMPLTFGTFGEISLFNDIPAYYAIFPVVIAIYVFVRWLATGRFGKILIGIRENEDRMTALGFNISAYKTGAFALSGAIACLAGALYGAHANFVAPSLGGVLFSTEVVVWVAIAGRASLLAALLGGILVASLSNYLSTITPDYWQLVLGIIFILVIVFLKGGVAGAISDLSKHLQSKVKR